MKLSVEQINPLLNDITEDFERTAKELSK